MKPKMRKMPSLYEEKKFKKAGLYIDKSTLAVLIVLVLAAIRFLNLSMWWFVNHQELSHRTSGIEFKYKSLNFSSYEKAKETCEEYSQRSPRSAVTVVSYFNLLQPGIFLVNNTAKFSAVDLGRLVVPLDAGLYTIKWHLSGLVEKHRDQLSQKSYIENSLLGKLFTEEGKGAGDMSFIAKPLGKTRYLKIPYLVYFFLPLVLLLVFASMYSHAVFTGFFYYTGLFLLFDFKELFYSVPLGWLARVLGVSDPTSIDGIAAAVVGVLLTLVAVYGVFNWKSRREFFKETLIIITFILLPLVLRF